MRKFLFKIIFLGAVIFLILLFLPEIKQWIKERKAPPRPEFAVLQERSVSISESIKEGVGRLIAFFPGEGRLEEEAKVETLAPCSVRPASSEEFREQIFDCYGFTKKAVVFIQENSSIEVKNLQSDACGGGGWRPWDKTIELNCSQDEGALHELSHVWWHSLRLKEPQLKKGLARDAVRLADLSVSQFPDYKNAIEFAKVYVYGGDGWKGMYCNNDLCVEDVHNIKDEEFGLDDDETGASSKVIDWEIYAGFSSWTMGQFKIGSRQLPNFMHKYFEPQFTGKIKTTPYYQ